MASTGLLFIFPIIFIMGNAESFVSMNCKTRLTVQSGQESLLECVLKTSEEVKDLQIRKVIWKKHEANAALLDFDEGRTTKQTGYSFAEPSWNSRSKNVSLLISSTTVQHQGIYKCQVNTNNGPAGGRIQLIVTAKYSTTTVTSTPGKAELATVNPLRNEVFGEKPTPVYNVVAPVVVIGSLVVGLLLTLIIYKCKRKGDFPQDPVVYEVKYKTEGDLEERNPLEANMV